MKARFSKTLVGRIVVVQEDRFRLTGAKGRGFLFTLFHKARVNQEDLQKWQSAGTRVAVSYRGTPNLSSGVAHHVAPAAGER